MAGYGYGNGDYSTYNKPERPRYEENYNSEHVRRPLIVDQAGKLRPLFQRYDPPRRESLDKNMGNNDDRNKPREESPYDGYYGDRNDRRSLEKPTKNGMGELAADPLKKALQPSSGKASKEDSAGKVKVIDHRKAMEKYNGRMI